MGKVFSLLLTELHLGKDTWEKFQIITFQENHYFQSTCKDHWRSFWWRSESTEFAKLHTFRLWSGSRIDEAFETKEVLGGQRFGDKSNWQSCIYWTKSIRSEQFVVFSKSQFSQNVLYKTCLDFRQQSYIFLNVTVRPYVEIWKKLQWYCCKL